MVRTRRKNYDDRASCTVSHINLLNLPEEVLIHILSFLEFKTVGELRSVCVQLNNLCGHVLNTGFRRLIKAYGNHLIEDLIYEEIYEICIKYDHSCYLVAVFSELLRIWRVMGPFIERNRCVFFAGELLDAGYFYLSIPPMLINDFKIMEMFLLIRRATRYFHTYVKPAALNLRSSISITIFRLPPSGSVGQMVRTRRKNYDDREPHTVLYINLLNLPDEVLIHILRFLNFETIAQLRVVCVRMNSLCGNLLNNGFQQLIKAYESFTENNTLDCYHIYQVLSSLLEMQEMMGSLIERKRCVFFPGELLDKGYNFLHLPCCDQGIFWEMWRTIAMASNHFRTYVKGASLNLRSSLESSNK